MVTTELLGFLLGQEVDLEKGRQRSQISRLNCDVFAQTSIEGRKNNKEEGGREGTREGHTTHADRRQLSLLTLGSLPGHRSGAKIKEGTWG